MKYVVPIYFVIIHMNTKNWFFCNVIQNLDKVVLKYAQMSLKSIKVLKLISYSSTVDLLDGYCGSVFWRGKGYLPMGPKQSPVSWR